MVMCGRRFSRLGAALAVTAVSFVATGCGANSDWAFDSWVLDLERTRNEAEQSLQEVPHREDLLAGLLAIYSRSVLTLTPTELRLSQGDEQQSFPIVVQKKTGSSVGIQHPGTETVETWYRDGTDGMWVESRGGLTVRVYFRRGTEPPVSPSEPILRRAIIDDTGSN